MNPAEVMRLGREALQMVLLLSAPALLTAVVIGTLISLVQAVTQVHEQTLSFLPKLVAVGAVLVLTSGWMIEQVVGYGTRSFGEIARIDEE